MKNSKGLKGVTDAMSHCKSMYAKGGTANKNQMIRSMKSYEIGGMTGMEMTESAGPGKRKFKRAIRNIKNAIKHPGGGSHTPTYRKPKCGGVGCWN
jgi:hypothetical protein